MTLQADDSQYEPSLGQIEPDEAGIVPSDTYTMPLTHPAAPGASC